ncbi:DUF2514 family protein [Cupriavidus alkaliphilus]|uniref:DUF2514 family protein n=1 Tax=Cupriavidus alkaliphilus TaxID=942866 RepID=UPI00162090D4|nr:DUF2514 family protein [Cupriavidus alkaliphilus]MBB2918116.1 hypothetical protein [Cupriavidus alkaliphilus]
MVERAVPWRLVAVLLAVAALLGAGWVANGWRKDVQLARQDAKTEKQRADTNAAKVIELDDARREDQRRIEKQSEIANEATKQRNVALEDARAAGRIAEQLRARLAAYVAERRADGAATAGGSPPAADPIGVLVDVLGRCDRRAGILAEYADAARIAGHACEQAYDALTGKP